MKWTNHALLASLSLLCAASTGSAVSAQSAGDLDLIVPGVTMRAATDGGPRRCAVIVQGAYRDPQLDEPMIRWSVEGPSGDPDRHGLYSVLADTLGFDTVEVLTGPGVSREGLETVLREQFASMKGTGNILYLHWIGHGYDRVGKNGRAERHFYTYFSRQTGSQDPTDTLSQRDIEDAIKRARETSLPDAKVKIATCFDACASAGLARGTETIMIDHQRRFDLEAFSASQGMQAKQEVTGSGRKRSAYTGALADQLWREGVAGRRIDLRRSFEHAASAARALGQRPSTDGEELIIFTPKNATLQVRVVSAEDPYTPLATARVELVSERLVQFGGEVVFNELDVPGGAGYRLLVSASGFCDRQVSVPEQGKLVTVPLVREFDFLRVQVLARSGAETIVDIDVDAQMRRIHHRSRTAHGSESLTFAIPRGLKRVVLEAQPEDALAILMEVDLTAQAPSEPESRRLTSSKAAGFDHDQLVGIRTYTIADPLFVGTDRVRLEGNIDQGGDAKVVVSVVDAAESGVNVFGSGPFRIDVPFNGRHLVIEIHDRKGRLLRSVPYSLTSPAIGSERGQGSVALFALDSINLKPEGTFIIGEIDLGGGAGPVTLSVLPSTGAAPSEVPAGAFRIAIDPKRDGQVLHLASGGASNEVAIDLARGALTDSEGRMLILIDLGLIVLDALAQDVPLSAPDGFWDHLLACESALDNEDLKSAKKSLTAARKLLPSKKDDRYVFIDYYKGLSTFVEAQRYPAHRRDSWYKTARRDFEKACKSSSEQRDLRQISPRAMSRYYIGYFRARDAFVAPTKTARRNAKAAFEELKREFPDDKGPDGQGLVQRLQANIDAFNRKLNR